jgi:hypothetical protein
MRHLMSWMVAFAAIQIPIFPQVPCQAKDLQLSITLSPPHSVDEARTSGRRIIVTICNPGDKRLAVPIGVMAGGVHRSPFFATDGLHPLRVTLWVKGADRVIRRAVYSGANQLAGYNEPWIVSVGPHHTESIQIPLRSYLLPPSLPLAEFLTHPCQMWLVLEVQPKDCLQRDRLACWQGKARSEPLELPGR